MSMKKLFGIFTLLVAVCLLFAGTGKAMANNTARPAISTNANWQQQQDVTTATRTTVQHCINQTTVANATGSPPLTTTATESPPTTLNISHATGQQLRRLYTLKFPQTLSHRPLFTSITNS